MARFKKGDIILCIDTNWSTNWPVNDPELLEIYTVDKVYYDGAISLCEIDLSPVNALLLAQGSTNEAAYYAWHFIKIDEQETTAEINEKECESVF